MHYARVKITRRLITPDEGQKGVRYECPACTGEVSLRSGFFNVPHFAHINGEANPDCENYHPPQGFYYNASENIERHFEAQQAYTYLPKQPLLTLSCTGDTFDFAIKIPACEVREAWDGKIVFNGKLGQQTFGSSSFRIPRYVPVYPSTEPYRFEKNGQIGEDFWRIYEAGVPGLFLDENNFFGHAETGGRKLQRNEALFRAEKYWAVVHESSDTTPISVQISHYIRLAGTVREWRIYFIEMPIGPLLEAAEEQLEEWLERYIEDKQPSINFWRTYPARISTDGTFMFPKETRMLSLKISSEEADVSLQHSCSSAPECISEEGHCEIFFEDEPDGEICIFVDSIPRLWVAFEQCRWFAPEGVKVLSGDVSYPLFCAREVFEQVRRAPSMNIFLSFPHEKIAAALSINGIPYSEQIDVLGLLHDPHRPLIIDGGNFGKVWVDKPTDITKKSHISEDVLHKIRWLVSINNKGINGKCITFPCQLDEWWAEMPNEALPLRHGRWNAAYYPHLLYLKERLSTL